jgi:hypothetical protein
MAPTKTGLEQIKAEFRERKGVSKSWKGSKINITKEKVVNILTENSINVGDLRASGKNVSKSDCQVVESLYLITQKELLVAESVEEQVLRIIGEISDDEFSDDEVSDVSDSPFISQDRYPDIDIYALSYRRRQKIIKLFGDDDFEIDATRRSGFSRAWQLIGIDVEVQQLRRNNLSSSSEELQKCISKAKELFSVDKFQLKDFEKVWESFADEEVSGEISCYHPKSFM